jgi:hypothetical protein
MPNYCSNTLFLLDSKEPFTKVMEKYLSKEQDGSIFLDFEKVVPYPKCIKDSLHLWSGDKIDHKLIEEAKKINQAMTGYDSFWEFCVENWGTKWNSMNDGGCEPDMMDKYNCIGFTTAWSPPEPIVKELARLTGHKMRLIYIEEGMDFCGELIAHADGSFEDNTYESIKDAPKELQDELGYEEWEEQDEE